jgi:hypothetical protein
MSIEEENLPRFLGFCIGIPGQPCGRRCYDSDLDVVQLERGQGVICEKCESKLFGTQAWSTANPTEKKNSGKGEGIVIKARKHSPPPSKNFRNYPKNVKGDM